MGRAGADGTTVATAADGGRWAATHGLQGVRTVVVTLLCEEKPLVGERRLIVDGRIFAELPSGQAEHVLPRLPDARSGVANGEDTIRKRRQRVRVHVRPND